MSITSITVGPRYRKYLGDLDSLAASIKGVGLLHPIVVTPEYQLIAGQRRLEACKLLGWSDVPVHVVDLDRLVAGEYAENTVREDFTPSEAVAIGAALKPRLAAQAAERKRAGKRAAGKLPDGPAGDTRESSHRTPECM
jgi:ParB family chromosome partitioning protein